MTQELALWIIGQVVVTAGAVITIYVKLVSRIVAIETLLRMMGEKFARALHSPTDHHGIDPLLDKYLDRNYELTLEEWAQLHDKMESIIRDHTASKGEQALASFLSAICEHKMLCGIKKGGIL